MRRILPILLAIFLHGVCMRSASAQTPGFGAEEDVVAVLERMRAAFRAGDGPTLLRHLETVDRLTSNHPVVLLQIARTRAALGDTAGALAALQRLAPMGLAASIEEDSAFRILHPLPRSPRPRRRSARPRRHRGDRGRSRSDPRERGVRSC